MRRTVRQTALTLALLLLMTLLAGCAGKAQPSAEVTKTPESIISLSTAVTQTLLHLGLSDKIIAVDGNAVGFEGLRDSIPAFDMIHPDEELLLSLKADIIFYSVLTGEGGSDPLKRISDAGTRVVFIKTADSIEGIRQNIRDVAAAVNEGEKGKAIISDMDSVINQISGAVAEAPKIPVYFEIAAAPSYSFGAGTYLNEMISLCGGVNIFADREGWLLVSEEQVLAGNPAVIFTNVGYINDPVGDILARNSLKSVDAVKSGRVFRIDTNSSTLDNEYIITALREMAAAINP